MKQRTYSIKRRHNKIRRPHRRSPPPLPTNRAKAKVVNNDTTEASVPHAPERLRPPQSSCSSTSSFSSIRNVNDNFGVNVESKVSNIMNNGHGRSGDKCSEDLPSSSQQNKSQSKSKSESEMRRDENDIHVNINRAMNDETSSGNIFPHPNTNNNNTSNSSTNRDVIMMDVIEEENESASIDINVNVSVTGSSSVESTPLSQSVSESSSTCYSIISRSESVPSSNTHPTSQSTQVVVNANLNMDPHETSNATNHPKSGSPVQKPNQTSITNNTHSFNHCHSTNHTTVANQNQTIHPNTSTADKPNKNNNNKLNSCSECHATIPNIPLIQCNGSFCSVVMHLQCTHLPPKSQLYQKLLLQTQTMQKDPTDRILQIKDPNLVYLCNNCDVQGSSQFLMEYLEPFQNQKSRYFNSVRENRIKMYSSYSEIQHSTMVSMMQPYICQKDKTLQIQSFEQSIKSTSLSNLERSTKTTNHSKQTTRRCSSSSSSTPYNHNASIDLKSQQKLQCEEGMDTAMLSSILVGQPIQLYCSIDNSYHLGRIIDWRHSSGWNKEKDKNENDSFHKVEYLIRFRAGIDDRKVALHQWIHLEDHPLLVGFMLIWVRLWVTTCAEQQQHQGESSLVTAQNTKNKGAIPCWRPAQIMLRSGLEKLALIQEGESATSTTKTRTMALKNENIASNKLYAFVNFLGEETHTHHAIVNLCSDSVRFHLPSKQPQLLSTSTTTFPSGSIVHSNREMALSIAMACMENEEQIRIRESHHLSCNIQNYFNEGWTIAPERETFSSTSNMIAASSLPKPSSSYSHYIRDNNTTDSNTRIKKKRNDFEYENDTPMKASLSTSCNSIPYPTKNKPIVDSNHLDDNEEDDHMKKKNSVNEQQEQENQKTEVEEAEAIEEAANYDDYDNDSNFETESEPSSM